MKLNTYIIASLVVALFGVAATAEPALAQGLVNFGDFQLEFFRGDLRQTLQSIINLFLLIAGLTAFFYIIYGGFVYLTAGGDSAKATQGRTYIVNAIIGVIIIAAAYALTRYVIGFTATGRQDIF